MFFTIITATRNASVTLPRLFASLVTQTFTNFEWIVQDSNSTDGTLDLIKQFQQELPSVSCVSEQDTGIYDAWNKALARVRGKWILFLGADDYFSSPTSLEQVAVLLYDQPERILFFACPVTLVSQEGNDLETLSPCPTPTHNLHHGMCLPHQGLFHRAQCLVQHRFADQFRIAGDYEFVCRTLTSNVKIAFGETAHTCMTVGGISASMDTMLYREQEFLSISRHYFPRRFPWKIYARLLRCVLFTAIKNFLGQQAALTFADGIRSIQGKNPLWAKLHVSVKPSFPCLCAPHITLVVTTCKRTDLLLRLLHSLTKQNYQHFSVVLVDQNPAPHLIGLLSEFPSLSLKHNIITPAGVSQARNIGLAHAHGDIIAFPDDDCWYEADTLEAVARFFNQHPDYAGVLGVWNEKGAFDLHEHPVKELSRYSVFKGSQTYVQFYRKEAVKAIGDFDNELGPGTGLPWGCGEDTDYALRCIKKGYLMGKSSSIHVHHPMPSLDAPLTPTLRKKNHEYALGRMYLLKKHKFPFWFKLANVLYPLALLPLDAIRQGKHAACYRWAMFKGRLQGLFL